MDLTSIFNQCLRYTTIPVLNLKIEKNKLYCSWTASEENFKMPVDIKINGEEIRITPSNKWNKTKIKIKSLNDVEVLNSKFYVLTNKQ